MSLRQMYDASRRFPDEMIQQKQRNDYVDHAVITQRLMQVFGWFDQEIVREIRGHVPPWHPGQDDEKPALEDAITGVELRITVHTDEGPRSITEVGEVEFPHNHTTDASRAKHATSDAIKRCAMRLGIGLHLWAQGLYTLDRSLYARLHEDDEPDGDEPEDEALSAPDPDNLPVDPDAPDDEALDHPPADPDEPHDEPKQTKVADANATKPATNKQKQKARIQLGEHGIVHHPEDGSPDETIYRAAMQQMYGVDSISDLNRQQISRLIDSLDKGSKGKSPAEVAAAIIGKGRQWLVDNGHDVPEWAEESTA